MSLSRREALQSLFVQTSNEKDLREKLAGVKKPNNKQQASLDALKKISRNRFIARTGTVLAGAALLGTGTDIFYQNYERTPEATPTQKFTDAINNLPESVVKDLLTTRVLPYFQIDKPTIFTRNGFSFLAHPSTVQETYNTSTDSVEGLNVTRGIDPISSNDNFYLTSDVMVRIPLLKGLVTPNEIPSFPASLLMKNGQPSIEVGLQKKLPITEGMYNNITIDQPYTKDVPPDQADMVNAFEDIVRVKEGCSFLLIDLMTEQTYAMMRQLGIPYTADIRTSTGKIKKTEIVHAAFETLMGQKGRTMAITDAGGLYVASLALQGSNNYNFYNDDINLRNLLPTIPDVRSMKDANSLLSQTINWANQNKGLISTLPVIGNINKLP